MGALVPFLPFIGAGMTAVSSVMGGVHGMQMMNMQAASAQAQSGVMRYNEQVAGQNAQATRTAGTMEAQHLREKQRQFSGRVKANLGASGVTMAGTPLEVMNENTRRMTQDILNQHYNVEVQAKQYESQAQLYGWQAQGYQSMSEAYAGAAPWSLAGGVMGAGATLLGAGYKYFGPGGGGPGYKPSFDQNAPDAGYRW